MATKPKASRSRAARLTSRAPGARRSGPRGRPAALPVPEHLAQGREGLRVRRAVDLALRRGLGLALLRVGGHRGGLDPALLEALGEDAEQGARGLAIGGRERDRVVVAAEQAPRVLRVEPIDLVEHEEAG